MPQIFISYARKDGTAESLRLYQELQAREIGVWRDDRIDPTVDFTGEIDEALDKATHVVVIVTPDIRRKDSFVRLEISMALVLKKPIIPLVFTGGIPPITIINHTYINFTDWDVGMAMLLERIKNFDVQEIDPQTQREFELAYLQNIGQKYDHWRDLYTDMAATARIEEHKVKLKAAAKRMIEMRHAIHQKLDHSLDAEKGKTVKTESLDELRDGLRDYRRVALIGDPGAGKTTTLERLAYEYASTAAEDADDTQHPLPLFVRLGAYNGEDFTQFLESSFGGLRLTNYLPHRVVLLLDGLNEMPPTHHDKIDDWLRKNPDVAVVVSCRKLDYVERKLPLQRVDVAPLDLERIRLFMGNFLEDDDRERLFWALVGFDARRAWTWYQSEKSDATYRDFFYGKDEPGSNWMPDRKHLDQLRHNLREQNQLPDMLGVVTNPFLMQIVIEIFALSGEPPRNKGDLFGRFVDLLLQERGKTAERDDRPWIADETQKRALASLAYRMQSEGTGTSVSPDFVRETFRRAEPTQDADRLLYFAVSASILDQTDSVRFSHQLLQEYFAAYEMGEDLRRGVPASKYFPSEAWWTPTGWEETALLLAGMQGDASPVVRWLTPVQPDLAYKVAKESGVTCSEEALQALYQPSEGARRSPYAVAEWGRLNHERDNRHGVSIKEVKVPLPEGEGFGVRALPDIDWVTIPAGEFIYGTDDKTDYLSWAMPADRQILSLPTFQIARYPVTYAQFQTFLDDPEGYAKKERWFEGLHEDSLKYDMNEQYHQYWNHPRDSINWYQAIAFCRWFSWRLGGDYALDAVDKWMVRLPTEFEWEKAARGTDGREYPWGNGYRVGHANIDEQEKGDGPYFLYTTTAVGIYPQGASPYGVLDMSGNVWEWCLTDYGNPQMKVANENMRSDNRRVLRGGAFSSNSGFARGASRSNGYPTDGGYGYGFRVLCAPVLNTSGL